LLRRSDSGRTTRCSQTDQLPELKQTIDYETYLDKKKRPTATTPEFRRWRDTTGRFSVDAALVAVNQDWVVLRKKDGQTINVPLAKLSDSDIEFVKKQRQNHGDLREP
jgi:hypothetical protein